MMELVIIVNGAFEKASHVRVKECFDLVNSRKIIKNYNSMT